MSVRGAIRSVHVGVLLLLNLVVGTVEHSGLLPALVVIGTLLTSAAASAALRVAVAWPRAPAPEHPVLFWNPRSGNGSRGGTGSRGGNRSRGGELRSYTTTSSRTGGSRGSRVTA